MQKKDLQNENSSHIENISIDKVPAINRIINVLMPIENENNGLINEKTLVDDIQKVSSIGFNDSLISKYETELEDLEKCLEWNSIENRPISELVLRRNISKP